MKENGLHFRVVFLTRKETPKNETLPTGDEGKCVFVTISTMFQNIVVKSSNR
jgi:hypothetical protein